MKKDDYDAHLAKMQRNLRRMVKGNKGLYWSRTKYERAERDLALLWNEEQRAGGTRFAEFSPRDRVVAATVIQWLGSQCGAWFLGQALEKSKALRDRVDRASRVSMKLKDKKVKVSR